MALLHTVTQGSRVMAALPFSACSFQGYSKSLLPASRLGAREKWSGGKGEVFVGLARKGGTSLLTPFHWPESSHMAPCSCKGHWEM